MEIKQSYITGIILTIAGLGTLIVSTIFCIFASNQVIGINAFEQGFLLEIVEGKESYYYGNHGFRFLKPVQLPEDTSAILDRVHSVTPPAVQMSKGQEGQLENGVGEGHIVDKAEGNGEFGSDNNHSGGQEHHSNSEGQGHGQFEPEEEFLLYLKEIKSPLLVNTTIGSEVGVKCYIRRFWHAAIFAITSSLVQIIVSIVYILWREKTIKSMSAFFYSYFFIFITHLACLCVVLNGKPNRHYTELVHHNYRRTKGDIFASLLGLNCLVLLSLLILTCVTCNTEEYSDRCIDQDTCNRKRSMSVGHILSAATASTDRLNS